MVSVSPGGGKGSRRLPPPCAFPATDGCLLCFASPPVLACGGAQEGSFARRSILRAEGFTTYATGRRTGLEVRQRGSWRRAPHGTRAHRCPGRRGRTCRGLLR